MILLPQFLDAGITGMYHLSSTLGLEFKFEFKF
jgi:hypothetical protein